MSSAALLKPNEVCIKILSIQIGSEKPNFQHDKDAQSYFSSIKFPNYSLSELKTINEELERGKSIKSVLLNHSFQFPFYLNHLDSVLSNVDKANSKFTGAYVLYTFLAWFIAYDDGQIIDQSVSHLLVALATISEIPNIKIISISAFSNLFNFSLKHSKIEDISGILSPLYLLFERNDNLPEPSYDMIYSSANWLISQNDSNFSTQIDQLFNFASKLKLSELCAQKLLNVTFEYFLSANKNYFTYFPYFFKQVNEQFSTIFLEQIPIKLFQYISTQSILNNVEIDNAIEFVKLPKAKSVEVSLRFQVLESFKNGLDFSQTVEFPQNIKLLKLVDPFISHHLTICVNAAIKNVEHVNVFLTSFVKVITENKNDSHIFDFYADFIYTYKLFPPDMIEIFPTEQLIDLDNVFNPRITVFNQCEGFLILNSIRFYILEIILSNNHKSIENIFSMIIEYPMLLIETIHRFINFHQLIPTDPNDIIVFGRTLMSASLFYQSISLQHINEVELARTNIFFFLSHIFMDWSILDIMFNDYSFSYSFLSFLFEPPIRPYILSQVLNYLMGDKNNTKNVCLNNTQLPQIIFGIVDIATSSFPDDGSLNLVSDFLNTLNDAIMHCQKLAALYEPLVSIILRGILVLNQSESSRKLIANALQFFALTSSIRVIKNTDRNSIENAIQRIYGDDPSKQIFDRLIQLIAGSYLPSLNPSFQIRQPKIVMSILKLYKNSQNLGLVMNYINNLCVYSKYNCIACNKSEIDIWLINYISELKENSSKLHTEDFHSNSNENLNPPNFIENALSLFTRIQMSVSSVSVVQRFVSLLSPLPGKCLSRYHMRILDTLNNIISLAKKEPNVAIPLNKGCCINVQKILASSIDPSFYFVCWIYHDTSISQYNPTIFSISEADDKIIEVRIISNQINILHQNDTFTTTGRVDLEIPSKQWVMITINYQNISDVEGSILRGKVNMGKWEKIILPYMQWSNKAELVFNIGDKIIQNSQNLSSEAFFNNENSTEFPSEFSSFGLFKEIDDEFISLLIESGYSISSSLLSSSLATQTKQCLFFIWPIIKNSEYLVKCLINNKDITICRNSNTRNEICIDQSNSKIDYKITLNLPSNSLYTTFVNVLIDNCKIGILFPLFLQIPMINEEGVYFPHFIETILSIFSNLFTVFSNEQYIFSEMNIFGIISSLLLQLPHHVFTYSVYLNFYGMLESITDFSLQTQLINFILMNWSILMMTNPENHLRIIRHWVRVLHPSFSQQVEHVHSLSSFLTVLRTFYYYKQMGFRNVEKINYFVLQRSKDLNIAECRSAILSICSTMDFDDETFLNFIGQLITISDIRQVKDLLYFLYQQLTQNPSVFKKCSSSLNATTLLLHLFNFSNDKICCLVFRIIFSEHRQSLITDCTLAEHINVILHQLTGIVVKESLFLKLIMMMTNESFYELLPICCWMALNLPRSAVANFIKSLKPSKNYTLSGASWCFWPLLVAVQFQSRDVMKFVLMSDEDNWINIYSMIIAIAEIMDENIDSIKASFIHLVGSTLLNNFSNSRIPENNKKAIEERFNSFFSIAQHFLFFRDENEPMTSKALTLLYEDSPFFPNRSRKLKKINIINMRTTRRSVTIAPQSFDPSTQTNLSNDIFGGDENSSEQKQKDVTPTKTNDIIGILRLNKIFNPTSQNITNKSRKSEIKLGSLPPNSHRISWHQQSCINIAATKNRDKKLLKNSKSGLISSNVEILMPSQMTGKIKEVNIEKVKHFGLRLSEDGEWLDESIAELCLLLYLICKSPQCLQFDLVICSFLLSAPTFKDYDDSVKNHLISLNLSASQINDNENLILYIISKCHKNVDGLKIIFPFIEKMIAVSSSSNILKKFQEIINGWLTINNNVESLGKKALIFSAKQSREKSDMLISAIDDKHMISAASSSERLLELFDDQRNSFNKIWNRMFRCMLIDGAPWASSVPMIHKQLLLKRDNVFCANFVPQKLRHENGIDGVFGNYLIGNGSSSPTFSTSRVFEHKSINSKRYFKKRKKTNKKNQNHADGILYETMCYIINVSYTIHSSFSMTDKSFKIKRADGSSKDIQYNSITHVYLRILNSNSLFLQNASGNNSSGSFNFNLNSFKNSKSHGNFNINNSNEFLNQNNLKNNQNAGESESSSDSSERNFGIEIISFNGKSILLGFPHGDYSKVLEILKMHISTAFIQTSFSIENIQSITNKWINHDISNFSYLIQLNYLSGRSFNDISQYPIFPRIFIYDDQAISCKKDNDDLDAKVSTNNEYHMRDLSQYIGGLSDDDVTSFLSQIDQFFDHQKVQDLSFNLEKDKSDDNDKNDNETVLFENAKKTCELVPEFYFMPECFAENFNFKLPNWSDHSPYKYVYEMRKKLESEEISKKLNAWIDLMFGIKSNSFLYNKPDEFSPEIPQTPIHLFNKSHPKRKVCFSSNSLNSSERSIVIQTRASYILFATVERKSSSIYSIIFIDVQGKVANNTFNFNELEKTVKHNNMPKRPATPQYDLGENSKVQSSILTNTVQKLACQSPKTNKFKGISIPWFNNTQQINKDFEKNSIQFLPQPHDSTISNFDEYSFDIEFNANNIAIVESNKVIFVDGNRNYATLLIPSTGECQHVLSYTSNILCLSINGTCVATANKDSTINIYNITDMSSIIFSIPLYRDSIMCCAISESFKIIVAGTRDGFLILSSINRGISDLVISLNNKRPISMLITSGWGFIVVYLTELNNGKICHFIAVYNVNGNLIKIRQIPQAITAWTTWKSKSDFDYVMFSSENGRIFYFEAFYLDVEELPIRASSTVVNIYYSPEDNDVVAVLSNGTILYAPFIHN